jgi:hypothetical protein
MTSTFVLIIAIRLGYGVAITSVPGYQEQQCISAAASAHQHKDDGVVSAFCVPGPNA